LGNKSLGADEQRAGDGQQGKENKAAERGKSRPGGRLAPLFHAVATSRNSLNRQP
jgi:hypothetical protein